MKKQTFSSLFLVFVFLAACTSQMESTPKSSLIPENQYANWEFDKVTHFLDTNFRNLNRPIDSVSLFCEKAIMDSSQTELIRGLSAKKIWVYKGTPIRYQTRTLMDDRLWIKTYSTLDSYFWCCEFNIETDDSDHHPIERNFFYYEGSTCVQLFVQTITPDGFAPYMVNLKDNQQAHEKANQVANQLGIYWKIAQK